MNRSSLPLVSALLRTARPWTLAAGVLLYALGGGIASYLGEFINWPVYWIGQAVVLLFVVSAIFLREYFDRPNLPPFELEPPKPKEHQPVRLPRLAYLQVALTTLTMAVALMVLLFALGQMNSVAFFLLGLVFALVILYGVPPFKLANSGYGELIMAVLVANLFPALAFLLQAGQLHRLLAMMTFPLTFLYLAAMLARSLQHYAEDIKFNRQTMMTRLGWQRGMNLHNILIAASYILLSFSVIAGLPWRLAFPAFFSMPVGLYWIFQMNNIANGAPPRWRVLMLTAIATLGFMAYFMNLALWTG
jgi:1,4-dihydroxy-2-naphthoate octaprenyltransferase